jgi:hypothetical protein
MAEAVTKGPTSQENWTASLVEGAVPLGTYEAEIYSDVRIIGALEGDAALGPYCAINLVPMPEPTPTVAMACLVLRVHWYLGSEFKWPPAGTTDSSRYHGGTADDEIAALLALAFGCRFQVGPRVRFFDPGGDPLGRPQAIRGKSRPAMGRRSEHGFVLPRVLDIATLDPPVGLRHFADIKAESANALVLAARLYQSAIWIAEADPNSAWIMLVSALEVAAGSWATEKYDSVALFKEFEPELSAKLMEAGDSILKLVAKKYGRLSRAAKKFREFVLKFAPGPPTTRPVEAFRIKWDALGEICDAIYSWRSHALHAGTPFPLPLCLPPFFDPKFGIAEKPVGLGSGSGDHWWEHDDTFVLLNTFEYIARGALLNWWTSLVPVPPPVASQAKPAPPGEPPPSVESGPPTEVASAAESAQADPPSSADPVPALVSPSSDVAKADKT